MKLFVLGVALIVLGLSLIGWWCLMQRQAYSAMDSYTFRRAQQRGPAWFLYLGVILVSGGAWCVLEA